MIFLIEGLLPESYFANNLRGLSVDMAVFRDLMKVHLPVLSAHLDHLQYSETEGIACYEPPLVNVFTLQWFLTLFSNCLPKSLVLRIWDLVFLEGNEILLRTALGIWDHMTDKILTVQSADEFYSTMGDMMRELMEFGVTDGNELVSNVINIASFPFPRLYELRERYSYKIKPFGSNGNNNNSPKSSTSSTSSLKHPFAFVRRGLSFLSSSDEDESQSDEVDYFEDQIMATHWNLGSPLQRDKSPVKSPSKEVIPVSKSSSLLPSILTSSNNSNSVSDVSLLKKQYARLRERQKQAHVILTEGLKYGYQSAFSRNKESPSVTTVADRIPINHLLMGKPALTAKRQPKRTSSHHNQHHGHHHRNSVDSRTGSGRKLSRSKQTIDDDDSDDDHHDERRRRDSSSKQMRVSKSESESVRRQDSVKSTSSTASQVRVKRRFGPGVRRASSILEQATVPEEALARRRSSQQETLSWAEIRRRRKASAPVIRTLQLSTEVDEEFLASQAKASPQTRNANGEKITPRGPQLSTIESVEDEGLSRQESLDIPSPSVHRVPSRESSTDDEQAVPTDDEDHEVERSVNEKYNLEPEVNEDIQPSNQTKVISRSSSSSSTTSVTELCDDDDKNFSCPEVEEVKDMETSVIPQMIDVDMEQDVQPEEHDEKFTDISEEFDILETSRKSIISYEDDDKELEERIAQNVKKEMSELSIEDALERLRQKISSLSSEFDDEGR